ncbi:trichohyalin-like protein 1 [Lepus europaeus]|uniref:trichohyalin-like protein 1 n=1 Tax=Lepus europaeus TaxID=9983 RepID=UPI002B4A9C53|nr:trichohyalin-like protein 1 [Lepus europaeus]
MPRLLRGVLCVMETFHKYAREDKATLTHRELEQLLQGELADSIQPPVIHAVQRNLNLLGIDSADTISFDEFVLVIFNLLNLCYFDMQSLLNSEPRQVLNPHNVDLQVTTRNGQQTGGTLPTQDKVVTSSAELSTEESRVVGCHRGDPQGGSKTHNLPGETSEQNDVKIQQLEADEQNQEAAPKVLATEDNGAQLKTSESFAESEETSSPTKREAQNRQIPREGDKPAREQRGTKTRGPRGEEERNLKQQQETTQRPSENQEAAAKKGTKKYSKSQGLPLQGVEPRAELADLPERTAARKPSLTQKSADPEDGSRTSEMQQPGKAAEGTPSRTRSSDALDGYGEASETQEPPAHEREHETQKLPVHGISETLGIRADRKEGGSLQSHGTARQRKTQPPALEAQTQDEKDQELQGSTKENDAEEGSESQDLISEDRNQNSPEIEGKYPEESPEEESVNGKNGPAARGGPRARERTGESAPPEHQPGAENGGVSETRANPAAADDGCGHEEPESQVTQGEEGTSGTPHSLAPEEGDHSSETGGLPVPGESQGQEDPHGEPEKGSHNDNPDTQKQEAPGERNRAQEAAVLSAEGEGVQLAEGQEQAARERRSQGSGLKGPGAAVQPDGHSETQESTERGENTKSLRTDIPGALDADFSDQCSLMQLPEKADGRRQLKIQGPRTREEEGGASETQEALLKRLDEYNSASPKTRFETEGPAILEEEDGRPHQLAGGHDDQQNPAKKDYASAVSRPGLKQRMQTDQKLSSREPATVRSSPLYQYVQEKLLEQTHITQEEHQNQAKTAHTLDQKLQKIQPRAFLTNKNSDCPAFFNHSQASQQLTRECLPDEDPAYIQQMSALQALEDKQREEPVSHRE